MMLRTPPSTKKRARQLEQNQELAEFSISDDDQLSAVDVFRRRSAQKDTELVSSLQSENARLSERLQAAEASCEKLEALCSSGSNHRQALIHSTQLQLDHLEKQLQDEIEHSSLLLSQNKRLQIEYDEVSQASFSNAQQAEKAQAQIDRQCAAWAAEKHALSQSVAQAQQGQKDAEAAMRKAQAYQDARKLELQQAHEQIKHAAQMCEKTERKRSAAQQMTIDLHKQLNERAASPQQRVSQEDAANHVQYLRAQLEAQEKAVLEAQQIKMRARNLAIVEEKLHSAQARADRAEKEVLRLSEMISSLETSQADLNSWQNQIMASVAAATAEEALLTITTLGHSLQKAKSKQAELASQVEAGQALLEQAQSKLKQQEATLAHVTASCDAQTAQHAQSARKIAMLQQENESLTKLLTSYENEELMSDDSKKQEALRERIVALEASQQTLQSHAVTLEAECQQCRSALRTEQDEKLKTAERVDKLLAAKKRLQECVDALQTQIAALENQIGKGDFNPATTKVIHFIRNPEAELAHQTERAMLSSLQTENEALRAQLNQGLSEAAGLDPGDMAAAMAKAQVTSLERKVKELEKLRTRLNQVFASTVNKFREACYLLFGYRIEMAAEASSPGSSGTSTIILKPQRSNSKRAEFIFTMSKSLKEVTLTETDFTRQHLKKEVQTFLERYKSAPAFLANYTIETFQKDTQC